MVPSHAFCSPVLVSFLMIATIMSTHGRSGYAGAPTDNAFYLEGTSYHSVPASAAWGSQPVTSAPSRHSGYGSTWADPNAAGNPAPRASMRFYPTSSMELQGPDMPNPPGMGNLHASSSVNEYMDQWGYDNNGFSERTTLQAFPRSVPQTANIEDTTQLDRQAPYRRDSDSQWSQITSTNDSIASSLQEPAITQSSRPSQRTSPSAESRRSKTWSTRPHAIIEKKYRENLNNKIWQLHQTLVDTNRLVGLKDGQSTKIPKSEIISNAIRYVNEMEVNTRHLEEQIARLTRKIESLNDAEGDLSPDAE